MNLEETLLQMIPSEEQYEQIELLAGCNYTPSKIALYLGVSKVQFLTAWHDVTSHIRESYDRGVLRVQANIDMKMAAQAEDGNITAGHIWRNGQRQTKLESLKEALYNGEL